MIFLTLLSAFLLSGIAAYYSVIGMAAIFPGSFIPVIVMGSALEFSKLVTASWLYRNWGKANKFLRAYLTIAVVILMLITSMGIFGFLSKAHMEHSADMGPVADKVSIYDDKIKTERENIEANRKQLKQMDDAVDQVMGRSEDEKGADKAVAIRRSQQKERSRLLAEISTSQEKVRVFSDERAPIANELRKAESDVGPIKYIAALIYTDVGNDVLDKAVRLVIMLIILVFDPLAVLLLIAGNMSLQEQKETPIVEKTTLIKEPDLDIPVFVPEKKEEPETEEFIQHKAIWKTKDQTVEVEKENIAEIKEETKPEDIVIDEASGESIPSLVTVKRTEHHAPGVYSEHHEVVEVEEPKKKLEPKYDYNAELSFKEKNIDSGHF